MSPSSLYLGCPWHIQSLFLPAHWFLRGHWLVEQTHVLSECSRRDTFCHHLIKGDVFLGVSFGVLCWKLAISYLGDPNEGFLYKTSAHTACSKKSVKLHASRPCRPMSLPLRDSCYPRSLNRDLNSLWWKVLVLSNRCRYPFTRGAPHNYSCVHNGRAIESHSHKPGSQTAHGVCWDSGLWRCWKHGAYTPVKNFSCSSQGVWTPCSSVGQYSLNVDLT